MRYDSMEFYFKRPIIFVSNDNLQDVCSDYALLGRWRIINANCKFRQGEVSSKGLSVKEEAEEEVGSDDEIPVLEIPSSSIKA